jgi:PST family polysaccharide transporter
MDGKTRQARGTGFLGGAAWAAVDFWGQQLGALLTLLFIGRLVGPEALGLMATAQVAVTLMMTLLLDGFSDALIQRRHITRRHTDTAFWLLLGLGCLAGLFLGGAAWPLARLFREPELAPVVMLLAAGLPLVGVSAAMQGVLQRQMRFRFLAFRTLVAQGVGFVFALVLAWRGLGVEALAAQFLLARVLDAGLLLAVGPRPGFHFARPALLRIVSYGRHRVGNQFVGFLVMQVDRISVALVLGPAVLGIYAVAERIATALVNGLSGVAMRAAFPVLSARQSDSAAFDRQLGSLVLAVAFLAMPAFTGLALVADDLLAVLMDARWAPAALPLALLALGGVPVAVNYLLAAAANARGRPDLVLAVSIRIAALRLVASFAAAPFGLLPVSAANLAVALLSTLMVVRAVSPVVPTAGSALRRALMLPLSATLVMAGVVLGAELAILPPLRPLPSLIVLTAIGAVVFAASAFALAPPALRSSVVGRVTRRAAGSPALSDG